MTEIKVNFFDGHGSKIRKVDADLQYQMKLGRSFSLQKQLLYKIQLTCSIVGFLINAALLNVYFILHYHLFFRKEFYFSECLYFSEDNVPMFLCVFWLRKEPSIKYLHNSLGSGDHSKCLQLRKSCLQCVFSRQK